MFVVQALVRHTQHLARTSQHIPAKIHTSLIPPSSSTINLPRARAACHVMSISILRDWEIIILPSKTKQELDKCTSFFTIFEKQPVFPQNFLCVKLWYLHHASHAMFSDTTQDWECYSNSFYLWSAEIFVNIYQETKCFFSQFEIIINISVTYFHFIWIPMLWALYGHYKYITLSVLGPTKDVRFAV